MQGDGGRQDPSELVPHRPPILCVDEIRSVEETRASTSRLVPAESCCDGLLLEPWLIEGLAQTAAVLKAAGMRKTGARVDRGMLVGVKRMKIHRRPRLGERLTFEVELIRELPPLTLVEGRVLVEDEEIARGTLKFYVEVSS